MVIFERVTINLKLKFMMKHLFFSGLLVSSMGFGQSLTQANEPTIGQTKMYYLCDTLTPDLASVTGATAVWDYTQLVGNGNLASISVVNPSVTPNASSFPSATKALEYEGLIMNYMSSTSTERLSHGFVITDNNAGDIVANFSTNTQKSMSYPFSFGSTVTDPFSGTLSFTISMITQNPPCTGIAHSAIDGMGTLKLPNNTTYTNVIRYKSIDTLNAQIVLFGQIQCILKQYEYYHLPNDTLPVFAYTQIYIQGAGGGAPLFNQLTIFSSVEPKYTLGLNESNNPTFSMFPNPSTGKIELKGTLSSDATFTVVDQLGRSMTDVVSVKNGQTIDLSTLSAGVYTAVVLSNGARITKQIVLQ